MRPLIAAALYTAGLVAANAAPAQDLSALATGAMAGVQVIDPPAAVPDAAFLGDDGAEMRLGDLAGQVTVVNFWATWCGPCRKEMPTLAALAAALGDEARVATIATGRNDPLEIDRFLAEAGGEALPRWRDPGQEAARAMGILGLPVTVILDREGREVGRLIGDADWSSPEALALVRAVAADG